MMKCCFALALALSGAACTRCEAPLTTTYSCSSIDAGSEGCAGGPPFGSVAHVDPDLTFPVGCLAELPECSAYEETTQGRMCSCEKLSPPDAGAEWTCAL